MENNTLILKQQYQLVQGSRQVMLNFIKNEVGQDFITPLPEFNGNTIHYLLVHSANTYKHWAANFPMYKALPYADDTKVHDIDAIQALYREADVLLADFLTQFGDDLHQQITNKVRSGTMVIVTPLQLFTHMLTHEFHHKGQIMTMCRLLGHIPPDTDVIRY
jgi:uncharacterized damage-inducible protein DinB